MSICMFSYFPFLFRGQDFGYDFTNSWENKASNDMEN